MRRICSRATSFAVPQTVKTSLFALNQSAPDLLSSTSRRRDWTHHHCELLPTPSTTSPCALSSQLEQVPGQEAKLLLCPRIQFASTVNQLKEPYTTFSSSVCVLLDDLVRFKSASRFGRFFSTASTGSHSLHLLLLSHFSLFILFFLTQHTPLRVCVFRLSHFFCPLSGAPTDVPAASSR